MQVGSKMLFKQACSNLLDSVVFDGEIVFKKSFINNIPCTQSIYLKDTVLVQESIEIKGKKNITSFWPEIKKYFNNFQLNQLNKVVVYSQNHFHESIPVIYSAIIEPNRLILIITLSETKND